MIPALLGITDGRADLRPRCLAAAEAGLPALLVREAAVPDELFDLPLRLVLHARMEGALAAASALGFGLHLPSGADVAATRARFGGLLGVSCHSRVDARAARAAGADYVLLSPIYAPSSKPGDVRPPLGPAALSGLDAALALGGVTPARVPACLAAGAAGVAVLGGIFGAADVGAAVAAYLASLPKDQTSAS